MGELILKCETKFKKLTWHALIGGCKTRVLHRLLIEFILQMNLPFIVSYQEREGDYFKRMKKQRETLSPLSHSLSHLNNSLSISP